LKSEIADNIPQPHFQGFGDSQQHIYRRHPKPPFNLSDVNGIQIHLFRQPFLSQTQPFPVFSDTGSQQLSIFLRDHVHP